MQQHALLLQLRLCLGKKQTDVPAFGLTICAWIP
jgi:hypothetical protein